VALCIIGVLLSYFHKAGDAEGRRFKFAAGAVVINYMIIFGLIVPNFWGKQPFLAALSSSAIMIVYLAMHLFVRGAGKRESQ
jgi:hypothetical protein